MKHVCKSDYSRDNSQDAGSDAKENLVFEDTY